MKQLLSDGQKARIVFAKLAMDKPHLLMLDEPNHLVLTQRLLSRPVEVHGHLQRRRRQDPSMRGGVSRWFVVRICSRHGVDRLAREDD